MLPSSSQYSPQGFFPFSGVSGFPGAGTLQLGPVAAFGGNAVFGPEFGAASTEQQILAALAQVAQQAAQQSAVTQQLHTALLQLIHQLAVHAQYGRPGLGQAFNGAMHPAVGFGQPFGAQGGQLPVPGVFGGQFLGQGPSAGTAQGLYTGFNPIAQPWANPQPWANRPQTIQ